jgi:spoIIIJ-associated protein
MREASQQRPSDTVYTVEEHGERIREFLSMIIERGRLALSFTVAPPKHHDPDFDRPDIAVDFSGDDIDELLANRGELLLALELLTLEMLKVPSDHHSRISFDCNGYRLLRMRELRLTAETAAERVIKTNKPFAFNPMSSRERRVLHLALRNQTAVRSESASSPHGRYLVIYPAQLKTPAEPPPPPGPFQPRRGGGRGDDRRPPRRDGDRGDRAPRGRSGNSRGPRH